MADKARRRSKLLRAFGCAELWRADMPPSDGALCENRMAYSVTRQREDVGSRSCLESRGAYRGRGSASVFELPDVSRGPEHALRQQCGRRAEAVGGAVVSESTTVSELARA